MSDAPSRVVRPFVHILQNECHVSAGCYRRLNGQDIVPSIGVLQ